MGVGHSTTSHSQEQKRYRRQRAAALAASEGGVVLPARAMALDGNNEPEVVSTGAMVRSGGDNSGLFGGRERAEVLPLRSRLQSVPVAASVSRREEAGVVLPLRSRVNPAHEATTS